MAKGKKTGGRVKGIPNKMTAELKDMILGALDDAGGRAYLKRHAELSPAPFMALLGKILPNQLTGADGGAIKVEHTRSKIESEVDSLLYPQKPADEHVH